MEVEKREVWPIRLIVKLYLPFIRNVPKYFIILENQGDWIVFASLTSREELKPPKSREVSRPNKYVIIHESKDSFFFGSLINYNTLLVATKEDFLKLSKATYHGSKINSPNYLLNKKDFENFKTEQISYFSDPRKQKRLTKVIFSLTPQTREEWIPDYLKNN